MFALLKIEPQSSRPFREVAGEFLKTGYIRTPTPASVTAVN